MRFSVPKALRKWLILPPIGIGVLLLIVFASNRKPPNKRKIEERARVLRVLAVPQLDVVPRVLGYGTAKPGKTWRAVAEVKGRVLKTHPELKLGAVIDAGQTLVQLDVEEYQLKVAQATAAIAKAAAQIEELGAQQTNYEQSLTIEQESLRLAKLALGRHRKLKEEGSSSQTQVDQAQRDVLTQEKSVQTLRNSLRLLPSESKILEASHQVEVANLRNAELDLKRATLVAPFPCRISERSVEGGQFVGIGEVLLEAQSTATTEIEAKLSMTQVRNLVGTERRTALEGSPAMERIRQIFDIKVKIRVSTGGAQAEWDGRFDSVRELLDPKTRTVGIVVAVDEPYKSVIPGRRPPLIKGMFCEVELIGKPRPQLLVVPRAALREGHVFIVDAQHRLERRPVEVAFSQANFICIKSGLRAGELVVVSSPSPAIAADPARGERGMLVRAEPDTELLEQLRGEATTGGGLR